MAKDTTVSEVAAPGVDYSTWSTELLLEAIGEAYAAKDMKLMGALSKLYTKREGEEEKAKRDGLQAELARITIDIKSQFDQLANELKDSGQLDGADGIWYAMDFGENLTQCRLFKSTKAVKPAGEGGSGKSSYVANPAKSADLLAQVGSNVYLTEDTPVTIDKVEHQLAAGTTFKEAYDYSTNGGWRNRVRMALLKEAGLVS